MVLLLFQHLKRDGGCDDLCPGEPLLQPCDGTLQLRPFPIVSAASASAVFRFEAARALMANRSAFRAV